MATLGYRKIKPAFAGPGHVENFPEAASQSFKVGDLVYLNAGALTVCAADPTLVLGIAMANASGTTGAMCPVMCPEPGQIFEMMVYVDGTPSNNATARADQGAQFEVAKQAAGYWGVDNDNTTHKVVHIHAPVSDYKPFEESLGDYYGRYQVSFLTDILQASGAREKTA